MSVNRISSSVQHPQKYFDPRSEFSQQQQATFQEQVACSLLPFADYIFISKSVVKNSHRKSVGPSDHLSYWQHLCSTRGISLQLSLDSQLTRNHCLPDGHLFQMPVAPAQHWPHCTALRSIVTCCLWHLYFRKSSVSSHSTYINTSLWRFLLSPVWERSIAC